MVFFICQVCNESLKKNKVEQHANQTCKHAYYFACMDCARVFNTQTYKAHTTCISEAEKYQGQFYTEKNQKGTHKQKKWTDALMETLEKANAQAQLKPYVQKLAAYDNVPRKKIKFVNFCKNSFNLRGDAIAEGLWALVEGAAAAMREDKNNDQASAPHKTTLPCTPGLMTTTATGAEGGGSLVDKQAATSPSVDPVDGVASRGQGKEEKKRGGVKPGKMRGAGEDGHGDKGSAHGKERGQDMQHGSGEESQSKKRKSREEAASKGTDGLELKPIKWKKVIVKELKSCGGRMGLKALRKACVSEVRAHPSYGARDKVALLEEFDREIVRFHKFRVEGLWVTLASAEANGQ